MTIEAIGHLCISLSAFFVGVHGSITIMRDCTRSERLLAMIAIMLAFILNQLLKR